MSEHLREIEQLRREKEQERREKEQERREKEQLKRQVQKTTLEEYLRDCHLYIFKALRIADTDVSSTGHATRVNGKYYPMWLRPWDEFTGTERDRYFAKIEKVFGDRRLFPESIATRDKPDDACPYIIHFRLQSPL
ncbi:hypothetical protein QBC46DRAFT_83814 [Diplogelasinospora grovesii]|uniref:Uncharacterized protein n=1 Tax=Diplogelasinospora grovesii TaxID=303347 RepID=A0AAN6S6M8_9PEZI|nr:hypothetical protein QBC46DRAFT_83814 [Diplogelasinospora grovesii]